MSYKSTDIKGIMEEIVEAKKAEWDIFTKKDYWIK